MEARGHGMRRKQEHKVRGRIRDTTLLSAKAELRNSLLLAVYFLTEAHKVRTAKNPCSRK
jgi:hypothetical protein